MRRFLSISSVVVFCVIILFCSMDQKRKDQIVLQVGEIEFTEYEYNIFLNKRKARFKKKYRIPAPMDTIKVWENEFIENAVLLAEARKCGYQNDPNIDKTVDRMVRLMLFQERGILFERCIAQKVNVTHAMVKRAMNRRDKKFELEFLFFVSHRDLVESLGRDTLFSNYREFQKAIEKCKSNPDILHKNTSWSWMSSKFISLRDIIYRLEKGDITKPLYSFYGISIIYVKDIIINQKREKRDENYKTYIERVLTHIEEQKSAYQFDIRIFKKASVDVKEDVADKLWDIIRLDKISEFDIARFKGCADDVILSYKINSNIIHVSVRDFMDYFNNLAPIRRLSTKSIFYYYLREVAWEAHALQHVDRLGICHEKDFVINKQLYRNSLIVDALIEDKIGEITEDEIKERYNRDNQRFNLGEYAIVSLLHFSSRQHALRGWRFCDEHMLTRLDSTTLKQADLPGLVSTEFGMKLHYRSEIF